MEYIHELLPPGAIIVDIGAGTGKFTALLARYGYEIFAVEPNADMHKELITALAPYQNVKVLDGSEEATKLPGYSVDVITCAQALHWFNLEAFHAECRRIGKTGALVVAIYNNASGGSSIAYSKQSSNVFFENPTVRQFPNTMFYTRKNWLRYMTSHSHDPLQSNPGYDKHISEVNAIFDRENVDGLI